MHPYTKGLINATPSLIRSQAEIEAIPGSPPDIRKLPEGCPFHPRCKACSDKCRERMPEMIRTDGGHLVRCHLFDSERKEEAR